MIQKLEGIQWGTSKFDPDLYIPRTQDAHVHLLIGSDSIPPDANARRHHHYSAYSLPRVTIMLYVAIICQTCCQHQKHHITPLTLITFQ